MWREVETQVMIMSLYGKMSMLLGAVMQWAYEIMVEVSLTGFEIAPTLSLLFGWMKK